MLAWVLAVTVTLSVCVCLSVTSRSSIETAERIELVFGTGVSFHLSYTVLKGISGISKNKGASLWNFVRNFNLRKICFSILIVGKCHRLSSRKVDSQTKLDRRRSTKLTIPPSSDARPL